MQNIIAKLVIILATLATAVTGLFGIQSQHVTTSPEQIIIGPVAEVSNEATTTPTPPTPVETIPPRNDTVIQPVVTPDPVVAKTLQDTILDLQVQVEDLKVEAQKVAQKSTEPLPNKHPRRMTEDTSTASAPTAPAQESEAHIELGSEDKATGLGRAYKAVTDPAITRYDEASDNANYVIITLKVFRPDGTQDDQATVKVTTTDPSQDKTTSANNGYAYLFKTPGEHTITFEAYGATKSITLQAE